jgi:hypothetical protein
VTLLTRTWGVSVLAGSPRVSDTAVQGSAALAVGDSLVTDANSRARVRVGLIGVVEVEPNSRVKLLAAQLANHRLELERGRIRARIWAPPNLFFVQTPSALAVDLGCIYTLEVNGEGVGALRVQRGWVAFELDGRESFVPEGAMCVTRPGVGPGTPVYADASPALQNALEKIDFELQGPHGGVIGGVSSGVQGIMQRRAEALHIVITEARRQDALTLWHLLSRTSSEEQAQVFIRLAELVPPPHGVTREGILGGDRQMRDRWWNALGLRSTSWWRFWKGPVPSPEAAGN